MISTSNENSSYYELFVRESALHIKRWDTLILLTKFLYIRKANHKATNLYQWVVSLQSLLYSSLPVKIRIQQLLKLFPIQAFCGCVKGVKKNASKLSLWISCSCTATDLKISLLRLSDSSNYGKVTLSLKTFWFIRCPYIIEGASYYWSANRIRLLRINGWLKKMAQETWEFKKRPPPYSKVARLRFIGKAELQNYNLYWYCY